MKINHISLLALSAISLVLCACRVETKSEDIPEAEGSGKKAINIRVEPMSRQEIKDAANTAIDRGAQAATMVRNAATTAVQNAEKIGQNVTTLTDSLNKIRINADVTTTP
jgi:hypothetical protein